MMATTWPVLTSAALCALAAFVISSPVRRGATKRTSILTAVVQQVRALPGGDDAGRVPLRRDRASGGLCGRATGGPTSAPSIREGSTLQPNGGGSPRWAVAELGVTFHAFSTTNRSVMSCRSCARSRHSGESPRAAVRASPKRPTASPLPRQLRNRRARKSPLNSRVRARRRRCLPGFPWWAWCSVVGSVPRPSHGWWDRCGAPRSCRRCGA